MKKITSLLLVIIMLFSLCACGGETTKTDTVATPENPSTETPSEKPVEVQKDSPVKDDKDTPIKVDEGLLSVEVTVPASLFENESAESIKASAKEKGFSGCTVNDDGSVTYKMSKAKHKEFLEEAKESLEETLAGLLKGEDAVASFVKIEHNDDFSKFDIFVNPDVYTVWDSMYALVFYMSGAYYQAFAGVETSELDVVVNFINNTTGATLETGSFCEWQKNLTESPAVPEQTEKPQEPENPQEPEKPQEPSDVTDKILEQASAEAENTISALSAEYDALTSEITTFASYQKNAEKVEAFYIKMVDTTKLLCIAMREYSLRYAEAIMASNMSNDDKYEELDELYDCIYDDAGDDIYDEIYDGILDDIYDAFYDGILDDAYDTVSYKEWWGARSNEYDNWSDTRSDIYDEWSDMRSDVYDFWSDMRSELWKDDVERANKRIENFRADIEKMKDTEAPSGTEVPSGSENKPATADTPTKKPADNSGLSAILTQITNDYANTTVYLTNELAKIYTAVGDTYDGLVANEDALKDWYELVIDESEKLYEATEKNAEEYYKLVATSLGGKDKNAVEDAMDDFYDTVYEDLHEDYYDAFDDGLFKEIYDKYYDGIIDDAKDTADFSKWLNFSSDFYGDWLEASSDFYGDWLEFGSDFYGDWLTINGQFWAGNFVIG